MNITSQAILPRPAFEAFSGSVGFSETTPQTQFGQSNAGSESFGLDEDALEMEEAIFQSPTDRLSLVA